MITDVKMNDNRRTRRTAAPHGGSEIAAPPQPIPGGQHDTVSVRRTAACGPWTGEPR
jgi:hypothetical protein